MRLKVHIKLECSGWRCSSSSKLGEKTAFEGWVDADLMGSDNILVLKKEVPEGWSTRYYPDSGGVGEPLCPFCTERKNEPMVPSPMQQRKKRKAKK